LFHAPEKKISEMNKRLEELLPKNLKCITNNGKTNITSTVILLKWQYHLKHYHDALTKKANVAFGGC
jgi:hypothetical protein